LRRLGRILVVLAILGIGLVAYDELLQQPETKTTYMTAPAVEGTLRETVTATGSVNAVVTVEVGSQLSGRIAELLVDYNDNVSRHQPVARLDSQTYEARRSEAKAALEMARASVSVKEAELDRAIAEREDARAQLAVLAARFDGATARYNAARANLERKRSLSGRNLITTEELQDAELSLAIEAAALKEARAIVEAHSIKVRVASSNVTRQEADLVNAKANIPQREALLELAEVELDRTLIRAPIDGVVIRRNVSEGQTVAASLEAPTLFTIAQDLTEMELHARVDETDIGQVKLGQTAEFTVDAFPNRRFRGTVKQIRKAPEVMQNVVTYTVIIATQNEDLLLLPGMTANIQLLVMESAPLLKVPRAAIAFTPHDALQQPNGPTVWVLDSAGRPRPIEVETGLRNRTHIGVTSDALAPGDPVVTNEIEQQVERRFLGLRIGF
jgi:HlyD family secretion protein